MTTELAEIRTESSTRPSSPTALARVFAALDRAGIAYCVLSGAENWPHAGNSDVDVVVDPAALPDRLWELLHDGGAVPGVEVVQWLADAAHFIVLDQRVGAAEGSVGGNSVASSAPFLQLHASTDCAVRGRVLYTAEELLKSRRHNGAYWVPADCLAFSFRLAKRIASGRIEIHHWRRLTELYRQDGSGCQREMARIWSRASVRQIISALESGEMASFQAILPSLRSELLRRAAIRRPWSFVRNAYRALMRRIRQFLSPDRGFSVVVLGVDGAGKSSVIQGIRDELSQLFGSTIRHSFPPAWRQKAGVKTNSTPHAAAPRSWSMSILRALGYWLSHYTWVYALTARRQLSRNALILHDRHLMDALVDPKRYRYGGPRWLLEAMCRIIPQPDLILWLDVSVDVAVSRKQEVPREEVARQISEYQKLVNAWPQGRTVDASAPLASVVADVREIICRQLAERVTNTFEKRQPSKIHDRNTIPEPAGSR